ncbi:MAG: hypothetical protein Kow00122_17750 [Thermoleophilia bacterium]
MSRRSPYIVELSREERRVLEERAAKYTLPYRDVVRARIILMAAEGLRNDEIAARLYMRREVVSKWRKRFFASIFHQAPQDPFAGHPKRPAGCRRPTGVTPGAPRTSRPS